NKKETESEEQSAEILRLTGGGQGLNAHGLEAQTDRRRVEIGKQIAVNRVTNSTRDGAGRYLVTNGGERTKAVRPHILTSRQRDERFWRPAKLFPIALVLVANLMHQREAGVPIVRAFSLRQSRKFRHQRAVCVTAFHGHDRADAEDVPPFNEPAAGVGQVVTQRHGIAWLD